MISERILTLTLRHLTRQSLDLVSSKRRTLPGPRLGRSYMLYAHIPFCDVLCPFCSFNRYIFNERAGHAYFAHLRHEMQMVADLGYNFQAMYVGGGTPTILIDELCETIDLGQHLFDLRDVSCETNPNHLTPDIVGRLKGRVQRLSVGVQSFDDRLLSQMKRLQKFGRGEQVLQSIQTFANQFPTLNIDMIFNFPSQTQEILTQDIQHAIASNASQISYYPLMTAPSVAKKMVDAVGRVDYGREVDYYQSICSSFPQEFEPTSAWTFSRKHGGMIDEYIVDYEEYVGIGSGAFSYLDGGLYVNSFSLNDYKEIIESGQILVTSIRQFEKLEQMRYRFMMELLGLRLDKQRFKKDFGASIEYLLWAEMAFFQLNGAFAVNDINSITLTPKGRYLLVAMMREFFSQVDHIRDQGRRTLSEEEKALFLGIDSLPLIAPESSRC